MQLLPAPASAHHEASLLEQPQVLRDRDPGHVVSCRQCHEGLAVAFEHPTRRALLDALHEQDGQTLVALTAGHDMTRIAVAKHLRLLEEAGLVVSRRRGREKLHFLNPVPIRLIHDRWVSKYTEPWAAGLAGLKTELEHRWRRSSRSTSARRRSGCGRRSPTRRFARSTTSARRPSRTGRRGRATRSSTPARSGPLAEGENLVVDPPRRLVQTMRTLWSEDAEREARRG